MIKARPHQQQPPKAVSCPECGTQFNNRRRLADHARTRRMQDMGHDEVEKPIERLEALK